MNVPPPLPVNFQPQPKKVDHASVWQLVLGIISLVGVLALLVGLALLGAYGKSSIKLDFSKLSSYLWILGGLQICAFISVITAVRNLIGHDSPHNQVNKIHLLIAAVLLIVWGALVYLGSNSSFWNTLGEASTPVLILSIAIPIYIFITVALYRLPAGSRQRGWAMVNVTSFISIVLIVLFEMILIIAMIAVVCIWLSQKVDLYGYSLALSNGASLGKQDLQVFLQQITPYIDQHLILILAILLFAVLVPMIEELLKPLGVWFLAGKDLTPAEGFTAGILCGATYGLLESLSMISVDSKLWQTLVIARVGTGLLHTLTAGLLGWALAKTWRDHQYHRLTLMYAGAVLLHGLWNFFAILMGMLQMGVPSSSTLFTFFMNNCYWFLGGLAVIMLALLLLMNILLRKGLTPPEIPVFSDTLSSSQEQ